MQQSNSGTDKVLKIETDHLRKMKSFDNFDSSPMLPLESLLSDSLPEEKVKEESSLS